MLPNGRMNKVNSICVYCGSSPGNSPEFDVNARALGKSIAKHDLRLVYGGGTKGLMGAVADDVMLGGGKVTGIIPEFLMNMEATSEALNRLDDLVVTTDMHTRKHLMFERSDAFVTLPGGIGTLEEVIEVMTWAQLGRHTKPIVLANVNGFWDPLLKLLEHMADSGFIHTGHLVRPLVIDNAEDIVPAILDAVGPASGDEDIISKL